MRSNKITFMTGAIESDTEECILWPFSKDKDGYGWFNHAGQKRAHRVAYALKYGAIAGGMLVMHSCDQPACINPRHLSLGTHQDNMIDMSSKGRAAMPAIDNTGENHGKSKLTEADVIRIRGSHSTQRELADEFGVARQTISDVISRKTWCHI